MTIRPQTPSSAVHLLFLLSGTPDSSHHIPSSELCSNAPSSGFPRRPALSFGQGPCLSPPLSVFLAARVPEKCTDHHWLSERGRGTLGTSSPRGALALCNGAPRRTSPTSLSPHGFWNCLGNTAVSLAFWHGKWTFGDLQKGRARTESACVLGGRGARQVLPAPPVFSAHSWRAHQGRSAPCGQWDQHCLSFPRLI